MKEKADDTSDRSEVERRSRAARECAAKDRVSRLKPAQEQLSQMEEANAERASDSRTRGSATDPAN